MVNRQDIQAISNALQVTLEKAHAEYESLARQVRWGEGPIYICGSGSCAALAGSAGYAFEPMLGWPVVARPVEVFESYSLSLLRPRSVLVMISAPDAAPEPPALAKVARERGSTLLLVTNAPESPLAKIANHVFMVRAEGDEDVPAVIVCLHAALNYLVLVVARLLKRHEGQGDSLAREFERLPTHLDWVLTQLPKVVRAMAAEIAAHPRLQVVGGGFYQFPAWRAARSLGAAAGVAAEGLEASEFVTGVARSGRRDDTVLLLSGSRSKAKNLAHRAAARARTDGARVLSITDSQDRELAEQTDLGILVPPLMEQTACTLSLCLGEWLAMETGRLTKDAEAPPPGPPRK
jgi:glucosamine--fructose-6-phosphate aminotransferase (isomerizing)